jgi:hypothetical protein
VERSPGLRPYPSAPDLHPPWPERLPSRAPGEAPRRHPRGTTRHPEVPVSTTTPTPAGTRSTPGPADDPSSFRPWGSAPTAAGAASGRSAGQRRRPSGATRRCGSCTPPRTWDAEAWPAPPPRSCPARAAPRAGLHRRPAHRTVGPRLHRGRPRQTGGRAAALGRGRPAALHLTDGLRAPGAPGDRHRAARGEQRRRLEEDHPSLARGPRTEARPGRVRGQEIEVLLLRGGRSGTSPGTRQDHRPWVPPSSTSGPGWRWRWSR